MVARLTYRSIYDVVQTYLRCGTLHQFDSVARPRRPQVRRVFMLEGVYQECPPQGEPLTQTLTSIALNTARARLVDFIEGEELYGRQDIGKLVLDNPPPEVWELRVQESRISACRLFGFIAAYDVFIVTNCKMRSQLEKHKGLKWNKEINRSEKLRQQLIPLLPPMEGETMDNYLSNWRSDYGWK